MQEAVEIVLGNIEIRQDVDIHGHEDIWVEEKGEKYYAMLNKYLEYMQTEKDMIDRLHETVFAY